MTSTPADPTERNGEAFGLLAVDLGLLDEAHLRDAREIRSQLAELGVIPKDLPDICLEKGYLTREEIDRVREELRERMAWPSIPGYRVVARLGRGGMGAVYKAHQQSLDRMVAIKVLAPRFEADPAYIQRFIEEARTVGRLNDPNIVGGIDVGEADGRHYFVMEYVEGQTTSRRLDLEGPFPEEDVISIGVQMAKALAHAAEVGLVHRDIKPHNIIITPKGVAKLCDLGLAKLEGATGPEGGGRAVGTPYYISPEQAKGAERADARSDIYSLGATLFHLATGEPPFDGPSPMVIMTKHLTQEPPRLRERNPRNSEGLERVIQKMMAKSRADRHATPGDLLRDLEALAGGRGGPGTTPRRRGRRRARREAPAAGPRPIPRPPARAPTGGPARRAGPRGGRRVAPRPGPSGPVVPLLVITGLIVIVIGVIILGPGSGDPEAPAPVWNPEADRLLKEVMVQNEADPAEASGVKVRRLEQVISRYPQTQAAVKARELVERLGSGR